MSLFESCQNYFHTDDLYAVLKVDKSSSEKEIKKGYFKASRVYHPDRATEDDKETATKKFQTISKVYSILSDKDKRAVYDDTGEVDEENDTQQDKDWVDYWRLLFPKITTEDIQKFEAQYKGSEEESQDIENAYMKTEGDMDLIMDSIPCSTPQDEERFTDIIKELIKNDKVPDYKKFSKETKKKKQARKRRAEQEEKEAEEMKKKLGCDGEDSLTALIQKRQASRGQQADSFLAGLEAKYAKPTKDKGKSKRK